MRWIGVDLHSTSFTTCTLGDDDRPQYRTWRLADLAQFVDHLEEGDEIAVEATGNSRFFADRLAGRCARVAVVAPSRFDVIKRSVKKTDEHDAYWLAAFLKRGLLPLARTKSEQASRIHSLCATRDKLVKQRTALLNKIRAHYRARGLERCSGSIKSSRHLEALLDDTWDDCTRVEIEVLVAQIRSLNAGIARMEKEIISQGSTLDGYAGLTSISGIGGLSATLLLSIIGDVADFEDEKHLASYFGLVPRVANSADTVRTGPITKRGSKLGRTALVQCSWMAIRYSPYLRAFYERIRGRSGAAKAIVATARKLLTIVFKTLKNGWVFEDFPNFVLARTGG